ncbi:MAG TPA: V-type ATPase 116kDa subunit family protein, partial [Clostridia bacterium]|nr:V-type ATPase 116kDa subunit family protein [Clostridia bacterium]
EMFFNMAGFRLTLSAIAAKVCLGSAAVCMAGIVLTGGRESKSWFKRILKGLYALYNVLAGWLGDILSYSRLLALGLATGVIASVINALGTMTGRGVPGLLVFIVVFLLGHALNFGINVLGAYVHSNRLEYVEFFGKFYEGGSRKFSPYGIHTKYYMIQEEDCHV